MAGLWNVFGLEFKFTGHIKSEFDTFCNWSSIREKRYCRESFLFFVVFPFEILLFEADFFQRLQILGVLRESFGFASRCFASAGTAAS